jgi:hypothetical protein
MRFGEPSFARKGLAMKHCWKSKAEQYLGNEVNCSRRRRRLEQEEPATCMLEYGHDGPHEFTPDKNITVRFTVRE